MLKFLKKLFCRHKLKLAKIEELKEKDKITCVSSTEYFLIKHYRVIQICSKCGKYKVNESTKIFEHNSIEWEQYMNESGIY